MASSSILRPDGHMSVTSPDGQVIEADTLQCVHCGAHWAIQPGSKTVRGYCHKCNGPVCGPKCQVCVPAEQWLENIEQGNPAGYRRIIVPT